MTIANQTTLKIAVSGAAGNIGYALLPHLASGYVFRDRPVELRLLEIPQALPSLEGTRMELFDCAFPCLTNVVCTADPLVAFDGADVIVLVGGYPRKKGMARKDLIRANTSIFSTMGRAIDRVACPNAKVLVVANPANTNCLVVLGEASRIPSKNFVALSFLDHQRARGMVARRLGVSPDRVKNVTVWGNHSETMYPDPLTGGYYVGDDGRRVPVKSLLADDLDWATGGFVSAIQNRGKAVIEARGSSSALSAAMSTADCLKTWLVDGTRDGETVSLAVYNDKGYYGMREGVVFSFPCACRNGEWTVEEGLALSDVVREGLRRTEVELVQEWEDAQDVVRGPLRKRSISVVSSCPSLAASESEASSAALSDGGPPRIVSRI